MIYLGIDPGSYTAIATLEDSKVVSMDVINLGKYKVNKVNVYYDWLKVVVDKYAPSVVYCEEPFIKFLSAAKSMNKQLAIIELVCQQAKIPYKFINPSVVKKTLTGSGKAEKDVLAGVVSTLVDNPEVVAKLIEDEKFDETDAIAISLAGYRTGGI